MDPWRSPRAHDRPDPNLPWRTDVPVVGPEDDGMQVVVWIDGAVVLSWEGDRWTADWQVVDWYDGWQWFPVTYSVTPSR